MKKIICFLLVLTTLCSCGTIFGGKIDDCQRKKPAPGESSRQIRPWVLVGDIGLPLAATFLTGGIAFGAIVWTGIDLLDNSIYKPCPKKEKK